MGVYIACMEMPVDCRGCRLMDFDTDSGKTWCSPADAILAEDWNPIPFDGRPDWCPLVEVKEPHGDLIDKNKLKHEMFFNFAGDRIPMYDYDDNPTKTTYRDVERIINEQPAMIEAEGGD